MKALLFNFKEWIGPVLEWEALLEAVVQRDETGRPLQLDLHFPNGETNPPVCKRTGIEFSGKGLICFDFDQTLTTAIYGHPQNPADHGTHSTNKPNPKMMMKVEQHRNAGNLITIVTARGEKEGQLLGDKGHYMGLQPVLTADKTIGYSGVQGPPPERTRDWHPNIKNHAGWGAIVKAIRPDKVFHLGAVSIGSGHEEKGPFIAAQMAREHQASGGQDFMWGILYDDGAKNVMSANAQQKRGIALAGLPVQQNYEPGFEPPAGATITRSASGM